MSGRNTALVLLIIIIIGGVFVWEYRDSAWLAPLLGSNNSATSPNQTGAASYACDAGKTISATYYQSSVDLTLSDGRTMTLPQTMSGSGIRYANADGTFVFWSEGNTAFITEGAASSTDQLQTFSNCVAVSNIEGQESWSTFASSTLGYSVRYPALYTLNTSYTYQELGPGKDIHGIELTIAPSEATGTNLNPDTHVSIEQIPNATSCTAGLFLGGQQIGSTTAMTDNGVTYSYAAGGGAAAGNLYEEDVYAIPGSSPCTAVRYFIHSGNLGNYPPGVVQAFNEVALKQEFDGIRHSLVLAK